MVGGRSAVEKPLVDVEDLARALTLAADRGRANEVYLVHSDGSHTLGEILRVAGELVGNPRPSVNVPLGGARVAAQLIPIAARLTGRPPALTPERLELFLANRRISVAKARRELGWIPAHRDVREMLGRTYRWFVETGQLAAG